MPWRTMFMRGTRVYVRVREDGSPVAENGRVEIRYKAGASKAYHANIGNLTPTEGTAEIFPDDHCGGAGDAPNTGSSKVKTSSASGPAPTAPAPGEILVYADGACSGNPGPAGLGVVMLWDKRRRELSEYVGHGTNNIAELLAIQRACEAVSDPSTPVRIYTDSNYSIGVVTKGWKPKANKELVADVRKAVARLSDVAVIHVRGHAGVLWNERADELARQAVDTQCSPGWVDIV